MNKQELSNALEKSILDISVQQRNNPDTFTNNCILYVFINDTKIKYENCAEICMKEFGVKTDSNQVKKIVNKTAFSFINRVPYSRYSKKLVASLLDYIDGNLETEEMKIIYEKQKENKRVIRIALFLLYKSIVKDKKEEITNSLLSLDEAFISECFEEIITVACRENTSDMTDYEKEILRLEAERNRANNLIARLQEEFDEKLEESKKEEQEKLMQDLNSSRYDCILDKLTSIQNGLKQLRREKVMLPMQINSLPSLVRQMIQFVEDCGITPMMDMGEELQVSASETEFYNYIGEPFENSNQKKDVVVVSTGWEIREKNIIISPPTVQEVERTDEKIIDEETSTEKNKNLVGCTEEKIDTTQIVDVEEKITPAKEVLVEEAEDSVVVKAEEEIIDDNNDGVLDNNLDANKHIGIVEGNIKCDKEMNDDTPQEQCDVNISGKQSINNVENNTEKVVKETDKKHQGKKNNSNKKHNTKNAEEKKNKVSPHIVIANYCLENIKDNNEYDTKKVRSELKMGDKIFIDGLIKLEKRNFITLNNDKTKFSWNISKKEWKEYLESVTPTLKNKAEEKNEQL